MVFSILILDILKIFSSKVLIVRINIVPTRKKGYGSIYVS